MKKIVSAFLLVTALAGTTISCAQDDKSKRPSPPATFTTTDNGVTVKIDYSQPSVKGRAIGKDIATYGQVWRTGANEATLFEVNKDVKVEGKDLKAGKYSMFTIPGENEWTLIFNKQTGQWGTEYDEKQDALRVQVKPTKAPSATEKMTFAKKGDKIALMWGDTEADFSVK